MTFTAQRYPAYKPSGVVWLGDLPTHWEVVPNRALMNLKKDVVGPRTDEFTLLSLTRRGVIPRDIDNAFGKFPSSFETYQVIEPGDLVFCLFDIDETPRTVGRSRLRGMVTGAYTRFVCADVDTREFLYLLYLSIDDGKLLRPLYSGLRKIIPTTTFLRAKVALPSKPEQRAIVRYIDHVDERIRRYISAKEKLIALLEEERQAVIHRAVTRGLVPNVPLKPSGVEWLGDVPAHWEVRRLKDWLGINRAVLPETTDPGYQFRYIDIRSVREGMLSEQPRSIRFGEAPSRARRMVSNGDTIVSTVRTYLKAVWFAGDTANNDLVCSTGFAVLTPQQSAFPKFVSYLTQANSFTDRVTASSLGVAYPAIPETRLSSFHIVVPPVPEQTAIVEHLDKTTAANDAAITRALRRIELLREYRTRLIADVVTGKLDVREAAASLPEGAGQ